MIRSLLILCSTLLLLGFVEPSTLTFELPDGENRCFFAHLNANERTTVEFHVISGGNFDVDVTLRDPNQNIVKSFLREQYDYFDYIARIEGEYELCFSNEFSSVTHKVVFMNWEMDSHREEQEIAAPPDSPLTMMDSVVVSIHEKLRAASTAQTKVRLQEATSRSFVEALNDRVTWGSLVHMAAIVAVGVGQVYLLRSLFRSPTAAATNPAFRRPVVPPTVGY